MRCLGCEGTGWKRRLVPHPGVPGKQVTVTRVCQFCQGKGYIHIVLVPSGKDHAANDSEENWNDLPTFPCALRNSYTGRF